MNVQGQNITERKLENFTVSFLRGLLFMQRTSLGDKTMLGARDILSLYLVIKKPGCSSADIRKWMTVRNQSSLQKTMTRLVDTGHIEDRRSVVRQAVPSEFHATPKGLELWASIEREIFNGQAD